MDASQLVGGPLFSSDDDDSDYVDDEQLEDSSDSLPVSSRKRQAFVPDQDHFEDWVNKDKDAPAAGYQDDDEASLDEDESDDGVIVDGADDVPGVDEALKDPVFVAMANHLLASFQQIQASTNLMITKDCFSSVQEIIWEHLWLPRQGYADMETDSKEAAVPLK